jgi:SAM-dependent methyltransferase
MTDVPAEMLAHYRTADEGSRITSGYGQLELLRTQEIVRRRLPDGPLKVLDVGGGTGVHAAWLAADGHQVRLFDVVPEHVASAGRLAERIPGLTASLGDARNLPVPDAGFDAVLMLGPLYHLTERVERVKALREAGRAVRPGGLIFAAAISRFASLFDGLAPAPGGPLGRPRVPRHHPPGRQAARPPGRQAARATETEPSLRGLGGHLIAVARVPG